MGRTAIAMMITCALTLSPLTAAAGHRQQGQQQRPVPKAAAARIDNTHLDELETRCAELKKQIQSLSGKRKAHVKAEKARTGKSDDLAFDAAVKRAVRSQAEAMNITME